MPEKKKENFYTVAVIPEDGSQTRTYSGITAARIVWLLALLCGAVAILASALIVLTPIRTLIPGYGMSMEYRREILQNQSRLDSLSNQVMQLDLYNRRLRNILESVSPNDTQKTARPAPTPADRAASRNFGASPQFELTVEKPDAKYLGFVVQGRISQRFDTGKSHYGIDIATASDEPVGAFIDGTALFADWTTDYGYTVILEHGGLQTVYKHCSRLLVREGQLVRRGETIAYTGNTGRESSGTHLHFEVRRNGIPQNPEQYLN